MTPKMTLEYQRPNRLRSRGNTKPRHPISSPATRTNTIRPSVETGCGCIGPVAPRNSSETLLNAEIARGSSRAAMYHLSGRRQQRRRPTKFLLSVAESATVTTHAATAGPQSARRLAGNHSAANGRSAHVKRNASAIKLGSGARRMKSAGCSIGAIRFYGLVVAPPNY